MNNVCRSVIKQLAVLALCIAMGLSLPVSVSAQAIKSLPPLHTSGKKFVTASGNEVLLQGVNIGGWLVTEGWMCGDKQGDRFMLERFESRFGPEKAATLMNAWYDNWFTTADMDRIKSYGFNLIRVPFGFRNLQDAHGDWHRNAQGMIDMARLDWVVREAAQRHIYVIFDLHIWPGQQENYPAISRLTPEGEAEQAKAAAIWGAMARHFKGNGTVAGFDLFNEPEGSPNDNMERASYEAIRKADPQRIVIGEAMYYSNFSDPYWTNAVWSGHYPGDKQTGTVDGRVDAWAKDQKISDNPNVPAPVFIGEMKSFDDSQQSAADLVSAMKSRDWSYAVWCYKAVNKGGWASFNYYGSSVAYDSATDSYDDLLKMFSTKLTQWQDPKAPINYYETPWWIAGYRQSH